jgi:signal transduction histidine kinase
VASGAAAAGVTPGRTAATLPPTPEVPFTELTARRLGPVRRYFVRHPVAMDVVVMAIFLSSGVLTLVLQAVGESAEGDNSLVTFGACVVGTAVLFWRRRAPLTAMTATVLLFGATLAATGGTAGLEFALAYVMYAVAASRPPLVAWAALVGMLVTTSFAELWWITPEGSFRDENGNELAVNAVLSSIVGVTLVCLVALAIGTNVRNRRLHIADLVERANALARDREQQAQLARVTERSRIAREMHDVVAHSLSVMIALADGAGVALERAPGKARTALDELSNTGRTALADMRRVLGVLDGADAPLEPQPGQPDVAELVERFRTAGVAVRTSGLDTPLPDDSGLQLTVYRIIQESLTNVLRHAPGTTGVDLTLRSGPDAFTVEVVDRGAVVAGAESPGAGRGLIGMRERAGVYGGTVAAGPWQGGWRVLVTLPWRRDAP